MATRLNLHPTLRILTGVVVVLMMVVMDGCCSFEMARIVSSMGRTHTSSTLAWQSLKADQDPPPHMVAVVEGGGAFWCRIRQPGIRVSGSVVDEKCRAPFWKSIVESDDLQVLISVNGFARLQPIAWDRLEALPDNCVSTGDMLVAYLRDEADGGIVPGYVDPDRRKGYFIQNQTVMEHESAILIVEMEPSEYVLDNVRFIGLPTRGVEQTVLGEVRLENAGPIAASICKEVNYTAVYRTYWGRGKGVVSGLRATVPAPLGGTINILWNQNNNKDQHKSFRIEKVIEAGAYRKVQLVASVATLRVSYQGTLTALFQDGHSMSHNISHPHTETRIAQLAGNWSQSFHLDTDQPVEETKQHRQVFLASSTTTTTTPSSLHMDSMADGQTDESVSCADSCITRVTSLHVLILLFVLSV